MKIEQGTVVSLTYRMTSDDGRVLDQVLSDAPLQVLVGAGELLPEVEAALCGLSVGDSVVIRIGCDPKGSKPPRKGFLEVPHRMLPEGFTPRVGAALQAEEEGRWVATWIREVRDDVIVLDPNHPLAGTPLTIDVHVLEVREATPDETAPPRR